MKRILLAFLCGLVLLTVGCGEEKPLRTVEGSVVFTAENYPKIYVTPYTEQMGINMAVAVIGCDAETAKGIITVLDTTDACYEGLINGECDIVIAHEYGKSINERFKETALRFTSTELDRDALVFMTNGFEEVASLTVEQLRAVYSAEVTDWSELGGKKLPITLFGRRDKTAVENAFEKHISSEPSESLVEKTIVTENGTFSANAEYDNRDGALGYTLLSLSGNFNGSSIKPLMIDGVAPSRQTVSSGEYTLSVSVNVSIRASEPANSNTKILYDWLISEQGRKAVGNLY